MDNQPPTHIHQKPRFRRQPTPQSTHVHQTPHLPWTTCTPTSFIHETPLWRSPYQMLLTGFATVFSSNMPSFHPRSVPEASNIGFADRFPGILHISMQRSGCGGAMVGFATRNRRLLQQLAQRSGCEIWQIKQRRVGAMPTLLLVCRVTITCSLCVRHGRHDDDRCRVRHGCCCQTAVPELRCLR